MTEAEKAEPTLTALQAKRDEWIKKGTELADERSAVSFNAHASNDQKARQRLDKLNAETATHTSELASLDSAIVEASNRVAAARRKAAIERDRAQAEQLGACVSELREICSEVDAALADAAAHVASLVPLLDKIHGLGCSHPTNEQLRVLGAQAVKTALMNFKLFAKEFEHLALAH
jgi:chromosome segregation ATPase